MHSLEWMWWMMYGLNGKLSVFINTRITVRHDSTYLILFCKRDNGPINKIQKWLSSIHCLTRCVNLLLVPSRSIDARVPQLCFTLTSALAGILTLSGHIGTHWSNFIVTDTQNQSKCTNQYCGFHFNNCIQLPFSDTYVKWSIPNSGSCSQGYDYYSCWPQIF